MIDESFVEAITSLVQPTVVDINGREYARQSVYNPPLPDRPEGYKLSSLEALSLFVAQNSKMGSVESVVIEHPNLASAYGPRDEHGRIVRLAYAEAQYPAWDILNADGADVETAIVELRTGFEETEDLLKLLKLISSITDQTSNRLEDDGVTQKAVLKVGIELNQYDLVPIRELNPFWGFADIPPMPVNFLFRLKRRKDAPVRVSLKTINAASWRLANTNKVREYLRERNPSVTIL